MFVVPAVGSLALLAAAVIAELLHRRDDDLGADEAVPDRFSVTAPIVAAWALVLGPLPALLVGAAGSLSVRRLAGDPWRESIVRALSLGLAGFAGGYAYILSGSSTGSVVLPDDLLGLAIFGMSFSAVKTLVNRIATRATVIETDLLAAAAEVSLGAALAIAVESNLWYAALLVPVLILLERLHWRLIGLRREVAAALETFANIVDERDSSTHGHSQRVAESVRETAILGLGRSASWQRRSGFRRAMYAASGGLGGFMTSARSRSTLPPYESLACSTRTTGRRCAARLGSPPACSNGSDSLHSRRRRSSTTANASTGPATTARTETTSRSRPIS